MTAWQPLRTNTILYCRKWHASVRFYTDVLQLPVETAGQWLVEFRLTDGSFVSIADASRTTIAPAAAGTGITLSWQVADVMAAHRQLAERGIRPGPIHTRWGARVFFLHDPEGHRIELWSSPTQQP